MKLDESIKDWQAKLPSWTRIAATKLGEALETLIDRPAKLTAAPAKAMKPAEVEKLFPDGPVMLAVNIAGADLGTWQFLFPRQLAGMLADLMNSKGEAEFDESRHLAAFAEFWDQSLISLRKELSTLTGHRISFEPCEIGLDATDFLKRLKSDPVVRWEVDIEGAEPTFFLQAFAPELLEHLHEPEPESPAKRSSTKGKPSAPSVMRQPSFQDFSKEETVSEPAQSPRNLDMLMDINLPITIELGRTSMQIREVLELGPGWVLELDKLSGEPVDIYVNERKFALGEVVVIEENFGVRITELLKIDDRLKGLK